MKASLKDDTINHFDINTTDNLLYKPSQLVHITNKMSQLERKTYNLLAKYAKRNYTRKLHSVTVEQIIYDLGLHHKDYKSIYNAVENLAKNEYSVNILGKVKGFNKTIISLLSYVNFKDGLITYSFPEQISAAFDNPSIYAKLQLEEQISMKSKYSLSLWEFFNEMLSSKKTNTIKEYFISFEDFAKIIGAVGADEKVSLSYSNPKSMSRLARKTVNQINELTNLKISISQKGRGKTFQGYLFDCKRNSSLLLQDQETSQLLLFENEIDIITNLNIANVGIEISNLIKNLNLSSDFINELELKYTSNLVYRVLIELDNHVKKHNIKGPYDKLLSNTVENLFIKDVISESKESKSQVAIGFTKSSGQENKKNLNELINLHGQDQVDNAINKMQKASETKNIGNELAYLKTILKNEPKSSIKKKTSSKSSNKLNNILQLAVNHPPLNDFIQNLMLIEITNEILYLGTTIDNPLLINELNIRKLKILSFVRDYIKGQNITDFKIIPISSL